MKIFLGTLNGGGSKTLERLFNTFEKNMNPQISSNLCWWRWHILVQGDKGANQSVLDNISNRYKENINIIPCKKNIGVVQGTNEIFDNMKQDPIDAFMILDDDISLSSSSFLKGMIGSIIQYKKKTCCASVCFFGKERSEYTKRLNEIIEVPDHGSGFTMYDADILKTCGYYDESLIQYGSDTDFNTRIKLNYGQKSLSLLGGLHATHNNQTGTKNCYTDKEWQAIYKKDNEYLKNKDYNIKNIYAPRKRNILDNEQIK